jgi:hypothetical protein
VALAKMMAKMEKYMIPVDCCCGDMRVIAAIVIVFSVKAVEGCRYCW